MVLTQEVLHTFKQKQGKKNALMAIKLDMAKAYDKLEWSFIEAVITNMGFCEQFTKLIMQCITTTHFAVLINGGPMGNITPNRGIRQGDPLSPFIFIICAEVLSRILMREEETGGIQGAKIAKNCTPITHMMFADDVVLFGPATKREAEGFKECLDLYCNWSGQEISLEKSGVFFSKNIKPQKASDLRCILQMGNISKDTVYLGMPLFPSRSKNKTYGFTLDRITAKVEGWKSKMLSYAGRATLVKSVLSATPAYALAVTQLPENLCNKLDQKVRAFWWGHTKKRSLCIKSWNKICTPKQAGGLGFRKMKDNNKALISKLAWQMAANEDKLWVRQFQRKYCSRQDFMHVEKNTSDSPMWKGILDSRELVEKGACYIVGNGKSINIWTDPWVPYIPGFKVRPKNSDVINISPFCVDELIDPVGKCWNLEVLKMLFNDDVINEILLIEIPAHDVPD